MRNLNLSGINKIIICLLFGLICQVAYTQTISGTWSGNLKVSQQATLKLVLHICGDTITLDSPDQGAYNIKGVINYNEKDSISISVPSLMMSYTGKLVDNKIDGTFRQGQAVIPLVMECGFEKANRPQTPVPPFPYNTKEIIINNANVKLAGTLTTPIDASSTTPVVVMVTGSGQQNRDEELFEHKPFAVIADYLARNGIATLRYDDRGVGGSTGEVNKATTADFANDALNMVNYLRYGLGFKNIGILGHSEGGLIAYKIAATGMVNFIVSIAGPSVRGDSILAFQNLHALKKSGVSEKQTADFIKALQKAFQMKIDNPSINATDETIVDIYPKWNEDATSRQLANSLRKLLNPYSTTPWMQYFISYSPQNDMTNISVPTMIIYGGLDTQVPAEMNELPARRYIPQAVVKTYPYANHMMQHAVIGNVDEYKEIEETFSPEILLDITEFIKNLYR